MPVGATVAIGGASLYEANQSGNKAAKLGQEAIDLQRDNLNFQKQRYSDYQSLYGALNKQLVDQAETGVQADLSGVTSRAAADTEQAYQNAQGELDRRDASLGVAPDSGRAEAASRELALGKAATQAGNISTQREAERRNAQTQTLALRENVSGMGTAQLDNAANGVYQAGQNLAGSIQQQAGMYGNEAQAGYSGGANAIMLGLTRNTSPTTTPTTTVPNTSALTTPLNPAYNTFANGNQVPLSLSMGREAPMNAPPGL